MTAWLLLGLLTLSPPPRRVDFTTSKSIFVDGNNLMMQRKVTKGREMLAEKLKGIRNAKLTLVFDGKPGEDALESGTDPRVVVTAGGNVDDGQGRVTADEWILHELSSIPRREVAIEVVTADRFLRRKVQMCKVKTINPVKFWQRYLPRLKGLKNDYSNERKKVSLEE